MILSKYDLSRKKTRNYKPSMDFISIKVYALIMQMDILLLSTIQRQAQPQHFKVDDLEGQRRTYRRSSC